MATVDLVVVLLELEPLEQEPQVKEPTVASDLALAVVAVVVPVKPVPGSPVETVCLTTSPEPQSLAPVVELVDPASQANAQAVDLVVVEPVLQPT